MGCVWHEQQQQQQQQHASTASHQTVATNMAAAQQVLQGWFPLCVLTDLPCGMVCWGVCAVGGTQWCSKCRWLEGVQGCSALLLSWRAMGGLPWASTFPVWEHRSLCIQGSQPSTLRVGHACTLQPVCQHADMCQWALAL
jgi:hypothetical protein